MTRCDVCGLPVISGMTDHESSFHCHDEVCFHKFMDKTYGKGKWMALGNDEQDEFGGYYITTSDVAGGFEGTGIYYTDFDYDNWEEVSEND